jgi:hypothetical protein
MQTIEGGPHESYQLSEREMAEKQFKVVLLGEGLVFFGPNALLSSFVVPGSLCHCGLLQLQRTHTSQPSAGVLFRVWLEKCVGVAYSHGVEWW